MCGPILGANRKTITSTLHQDLEILCVLRESARYLTALTAAGKAAGQVITHFTSLIPSLHLGLVSKLFLFSNYNFKLRHVFTS
jgi:hypothetical protein